MSRTPLGAPAGAGVPANRSFSARLGRRAARGDREAFETIFEEYHQELYRYCLSIVRDREDAEDALQATMAAAMRSLPGDERDIPLRPWLYRVAHNESVSLLRGRTPTIDAEGEDPLEATGSVVEEAEGRERMRQLVADLQSLPDRQRSALVMRELNDLSYAEIGASLDSSAAAARQTVYEARTALFAFREGRSMECEPVREAISSRDGRRLRGRKIRAHLRVCDGCQDFEAVIAQRRSDMQALFPLPAVAASGLLAGLVGGTGGGAAVVGAGATGAGAGAAGAGGAGLFGSGLAGGLAIKGASLVAATAVAAGAADLGGVIDLPNPLGGSDTAREGTSPPGESGSSQSGAGAGGTSTGAAGSPSEGAAGQAGNGNANGGASQGQGQGGRSEAGEGASPGKSESAPGHGGSTPGKSESAPGQTGASPGKSESAPGHSGSSPGNSGASPSKSETAPGHTGTSPGKSESAPGHSGSSPGNSGSAPGQTGTAPGKSGSPPGQSTDAPGNSGSAPGQTKPSGGSATPAIPEPPTKPEPPVKPATPAGGGTPPGKATGNPHGDGEFTTGEFTAETTS